MVISLFVGWTRFVPWRFSTKLSRCWLESYQNHRHRYPVPSLPMPSLSTRQLVGFPGHNLPAEVDSHWASLTRGSNSISRLCPLCSQSSQRLPSQYLQIDFSHSSGSSDVVFLPEKEEACRWMAASQLMATLNRMDSRSIHNTASCYFWQIPQVIFLLFSIKLCNVRNFLWRPGMWSFSQLWVPSTSIPVAKSQCADSQFLWAWPFCIYQKPSVDVCIVGAALQSLY